MGKNITDDQFNEVRTITYASVTRALGSCGESGATMQDLVATFRAAKSLPESADPALAKHIKGLVAAGVTTGDIEKLDLRTYRHMTPEERAAAAKRQEERAALLSRVRSTIKELAMPDSAYSLHEGHIVLPFATFLELCE